MIKGIGPATIYVDGKEIGGCVVDSVNVEYEQNENPYKDVDFSTLDDNITIQYEGELIMTRGTIETPKEDNRISSNVLSRYFKGIELDWGVYKKISQSLDKLGRAKNGK